MSRKDGGAGIEHTTSMGMIDKAWVIDQTDDQVICNRHHLCQLFDRHAGMIFLISDIAAVMEAVFNATFAVGDDQQSSRIGLLSGQTG